MPKSEIAPHVTAWVLVALVVAVILYDTWAATSAAGAPTISGFFRAVSLQQSAAFAVARRRAKRGSLRAPARANCAARSCTPSRNRTTWS